MAVLARTKVRSRFMYFISAACQSRVEGLLDDPEIDVVYNPVSRIFHKFESSNLKLSCLTAAQWPSLRVDYEGTRCWKTCPA